MNNKGFIATSLVYAFFLVFVAVVATVLATYTHNRILISNVNGGVQEDLNQSIGSKYITIKNILKNSDFEEDSYWTFGNTYNLDPTFSSYRGVKSLSISKGDSFIEQRVKNLIANHYYYVRYYIFRNGLFNEGSSSAVTLQNLENNNITVDFNLNFVTDEVYANWDLMSNIAQINKEGDYKLSIVGTNLDGTFSNLSIDSLMLIDVTDLISAGNSVPDTKTFMDTLDYFEGQKSIMKP